MHGNQWRRTDDQRYRLQIRKRIVGHVLDQMRRNDDRAFCCHIQRVAIRVCTDDGVRSYRATGAGAVYHHDWLAKRLLQTRRKQSREKVRTAARRKAGDNTYPKAREVRWEDQPTARHKIT